MTTFDNLPTIALVESNLNPRKHLSGPALQELADSIAQIGIQQALLVRPLPAARLAETFYGRNPGQALPTHEIVAGHRRHRACVIANVTTLPVMIRHMTDEQVYEAQMVENLQREDLSELDEAYGYQAWMAEVGVSADQVAAKIGKSRRYVYDRLSLLHLHPDSKAALNDGLIDVSRAQLLARVPDSALQAKALIYALAVGPTPAPSVRDLQVWLRQNCMLDLAHAPFKITASGLHPTAKSCKTCILRTGASPDVFSEVIGADICTSPACYNTKAANHLQACQTKAEAKGMRLVHGSEAKTICYPKSSALKGYSPLSQVREDAQDQRLNALLGKAPEGAVLIENPYTLELIEALPTAEAEAALLAKGLIKATKPTTKAPTPGEAMDHAEDVAVLKAQTQQAIATKFLQTAWQAIVTATHKQVDMTDDLCTPLFLRAWLIDLVPVLPFKLLAEMLDVDMPSERDADKFMLACTLNLSSLSSAGIYRATHLYAVNEVLGNDNPDMKSSSCLYTALAMHDLSADDLKKEAAAFVKAEITQKIKALKPQKTPIPTTQLAQPSTCPPATAQTPKPKPTAPRGKAKLSTEQAQLGIAEAMQGIEAPPADGEVPKLKAAKSFELGQQVRVIIMLPIEPGQELPLHLEKYIGKTGKVTALPGPEASTHEVTFCGRNGGIADFRVRSLEAA